MLCHTTKERGGASFLANAGLALAAILGTLLIGDSAQAQYRDLDRRYDTRDYRDDFNSRDYRDQYPTRDYRGQYDTRDYRDRYDSRIDPTRDHDTYQCDYTRRLEDRTDRPVYGDFRGDRYSPEPNYGNDSRDRLSRRGRNWDRLDLDRRDRLDGRDDYITRRIPLPTDLRDLDLDRDMGRDIRYRDEYDPYEAPRLRDDRVPNLLPGLPSDIRIPNYDRNNNYAPPRPAVRPADQLTETEQIQQRLSARYGNPLVQRFLYNVSPEQTLNVYREASQLIDSRHMQPTSYQTRAQRAAKNLSQGLRNREFLAANRISPSATQMQSFENAMTQLMQTQRVQSQNEAVQMIYAMANTAHQHVGIRPTTVVLEFIYGATETLDKYSTFLPEETGRGPSASVLGDTVVGIGVEIKPHDDGAEVVKALQGGPAAAAGLQPGDLIVGINGRSVRGSNLNQIVDLIAGRVGTPIYLSVVRDGRQLSPITMTRRQVTIQSVSEVRMMGQRRDVGYVKVDKFAQKTSEEMDKALWNLHNSGMKSLVIDLRGNPGGLLTTAIELSNKFLPSGTIVSTRGRTSQDNMIERANSTRTWQVPVVVLIDGNSASASEIFAAAIQENNRGTIVGRQSYGKGTVQTHFPLRSIGGNLKLTTAKFYSPKGREMAGNGVMPDVQVTETNYPGTASTSDQDIAMAVDVAQSGRTRDDLASTPRLQGLFN